MENGWWNRFRSRGRGTSRNSASASAGDEDFDDVHLPPGASTDDESTSGNSDAGNGGKKKKTSEKAADKSEEDETKTDDTVVVIVDDEGDDGDGDEDDPDEDDPDDNPDDDEPETDDKNKDGGKSSSRGKKKPPMEKKNETPAPGTGATAPTQAPTNTTEHPVLTAALAAGIDTDAKFATLQASAKVGEDALASARTGAKAAAVAFFGQGEPGKIEAAEKLIAGTNDLASLNLLTENWHSGAPGGNRAQGANGGGKRQTRSNAPAAPAAGASTDKKPAADVSTAAPRSGNVYAQYNQAGK